MFSCISPNPPSRERPSQVLYAAGIVLAFLHATNVMVRLVSPPLLLWAADRAARAWRLAGRPPHAVVALEALPGGATRVVVVPTAAPPAGGKWGCAAAKFAKPAQQPQPGQWAYLSLSGVPGISSLELHPFSLAPPRPGATGDPPHALHFIVQATGAENSFTRRLHAAALALQHGAAAGASASVSARGGGSAKGAVPPPSAPPPQQQQRLLGGSPSRRGGGQSVQRAATRDRWSKATAAAQRSVSLRYRTAAAATGGGGGGGSSGRGQPPAVKRIQSSVQQRGAVASAAAEALPSTSFRGGGGGGGFARSVSARGSGGGAGGGGGFSSSMGESPSQRGVAPPRRTTPQAVTEGTSGAPELFSVPISGKGAGFSLPTTTSSAAVVRFPGAAAAAAARIDGPYGLLGLRLADYQVRWIRIRALAVVL